MKLYDRTFNAVEKALDLRFKRHVVLGSNAANSDTPNYRAREVDFAGELRRALAQENPKGELKKTDPRHMDIYGADQAHLVYDNSVAAGADGNNVDLDINMGKISSNARAYSGAATLLSMKLRMLRAAARGKGGF